MNDKKDIATLADIKLLVNVFYDKIKADSFLAPVFNERIKDNWPQHLEKMYKFWQTVLLGEHTYLGSPFLPHANLPVNHAHFHQWLALFNKTLDELFSGEKTKEALWRANKMAALFEMKIGYYQSKKIKPLV